MIRTSYLRVYQPVEAFAPEERQQWVDQWTDHPARPQDQAQEVLASKRWLIRTALPDEDLFGGSSGAFVRKSDDGLLICPWRTNLRMLAGLLAFRNSIPDEIAEAFVPESQARRAAHELASLGEEHPEVRSHILHANWHVPLRWFVAFDDAERILTEDKDGLRVRYETTLTAATQRLARGVAILESTWIDDGVITAVRELHEWLDDFNTDGLLELDYGTVAGMFTDDELVEDRSAAEVGQCLTALEGEDLMRAGRIFGTLTDRWTEARAKEVVN